MFADAEQRQRDWHPHEPLLYSTPGYLYCDLLLWQREARPAHDRAIRTIEIAHQNNWVLDVGLDTVTLGRAHLALALQSLENRATAEPTRDDACGAAARLDEAVESLRASGQNDQVPRGLLARAAFRRALGDWDGAKRDLNEDKRDHRTGKNATVLVRLRTRTRAARAGAARGLRAAQWPRRGKPTTASLA
jgi:hypothetical protein